MLAKLTTWTAALLLLSFSTSLAGSPDPPTLVYSTSVNVQPVARTSRTDLRDVAFFEGVYYDPTVGDLVTLPGAGAFYTGDPMTLGGGFSGPTSVSHVEMTAAPKQFHATILNSAWSQGGTEEFVQGFVNTSSGVGKWFVLKGARKPVSLRADIAFQGTLYANAVPPGEQAAAFYTHSLGVIAYPSDMVMDYAVTVNGSVQEPGMPCGPYGTGTIPDECFVSDGSTHTVNRVVRSNPFVVLPDVPFRLSLILNAAAVSSGPSTNEASVDFSDPGLGTSTRFPSVEGLTPEGFVVDLDGNPATRDVATLQSLGYSLQAMPDAATFFLLSVKSSYRTTLAETVVTRTGQLSAPVTGNLQGSITMSPIELVTVTTGAFAGKGFFTADWQATLEGITYRGSWRGAAYASTSAAEIDLKGVVSGDIDATAEGVLTESVPGSGVYDRVKIDWTLSDVKGGVASGAVAMTGTVSWDAPRSSTPRLELVQFSADGTTTGESAGSVGMVVTALRVTSPTHPSVGRGFALLSYQSPEGSGDAWTHAQTALPGVIELGGMATGPLAGLLHLAVDETQSPALVTGLQRRTDLGLPPMADVEVKSWTSNGVSPGEMLTYVINYSNRGLRPADDVMVIDKLSPVVDYVSSSAGGVYNADSHEVTFALGTLPPRSSGRLTVRVSISWGLSWMSSMTNEVLIATSSAERDATLSPATTALTADWDALQIGYADNDWDVRNPPPDYDPTDPAWDGLTPDSFKNRTEQALQLIKQYRPGWYQYLKRLYDKGKIHADPDLNSSEWNNRIGVKHLYLNGQDLKVTNTDAQWAMWQTDPAVFVWLVDLAAKNIHEARHSDGQYIPAVRRARCRPSRPRASSPSTCSIRSSRTGRRIAPSLWRSISS